MDLETRLQSIEQGASTGTVRVGDFSFDSELEIVELLKEEGINPKRLAIAVDCNSLFAHHLSGEAKVDDTSTEFKNLKGAGMGDNTCVKYISSFRQIHPNLFLDSKNTPIKEGARFPMLENEKAWKGSSTTKGGFKVTNKAVLDSVKLATTYFNQYLQKAPKNATLVSRSVAAHGYLVLHCFVVSHRA